MQSPKLLSRIAGAALAAFLLSLLLRGWSGMTQLVVASSILMFACCWASAAHLLGARAALRFVGIAVSVGWLAEQLGTSYGWFFGSYTYTDVLGPRVGEVPCVIPLMWFALSYVGYVLANLIVWQAPSDGAAPLGQSITMSLLAALIVTAYDLGADPYMVYKLKAWTMTMKDGYWFGETLQGFAGWMLVSFAIVFLFRLSLRKAAATPSSHSVGDVLVPLGLYGGLMLFQVALGDPVETRTIALFAMGIPLLSALSGMGRWRSAHGAVVSAA